jgi:hypothetical protein
LQLTSIADGATIWSRVAVPARVHGQLVQLELEVMDHLKENSAPATLNVGLTFDTSALIGLERHRRAIRKGS